MKRQILVITAMLAVMVAMTGIAAATYVNIDTSNALTEADIISNPLDGTTTSTNVVIGSITGSTGSRTLRVVTSNANLYAKVYEGATDTGFGNNIAASTTWSWTGSPNYRILNIDVYGTEAGTVTVYDELTGTVMGSAGVNSGSADVNVPEFPTVALPIAAVIGLVFFFQQKKKKE